jgi:hypothetical protein
MNKQNPIYLLACGTAPMTFVGRDGVCIIITGKTTTCTVAARWWIAAQDARAWPARLAGSLASPPSYHRPSRRYSALKFIKRGFA